MLPLLFDEHVPVQIVAGLQQRQPGLDLARVQDVGLGQTPDPVVLEKAAALGRVVVSCDKKTLAVDAWDRVAQGLCSEARVPSRVHPLLNRGACSEARVPRHPPGRCLEQKNRVAALGCFTRSGIDR
jgi:hypothetical protein